MTFAQQSRPRDGEVCQGEWWLEKMWVMGSRLNAYIKQARAIVAALISICDDVALCQHPPQRCKTDAIPVHAEQNLPRLSLPGLRDDCLTKLKRYRDVGLIPKYHSIENGAVHQIQWIHHKRFCGRL